MKLKTQLKKAATPQARALIFRAALAAKGTKPRAIAQKCATSEATVTRVLQWRNFGGAKVRAVQEAVVEVLGLSLDDCFPDRGPAIAGGGFQSQRRNW